MGEIINKEFYELLYHIQTKKEMLKDWNTDKIIPMFRQADKETQNRVQIIEELC